MKILTKLVRKTLILNKKRTLITLIGIILSCSLIGGVATLFSSFQKFFQDLTIETGGNFHLLIDNVNLETINNFKGEEFFEEVMIQQNKGFYIGKSDKVDQVFSLVANDKKMFDNFNIKLDEGRLPENNQEIILPYFEKTKYKLKDKITLEIFETFEDLEKLNNSIKKEYIIVGFLEENIFSSNVVFTFLEEQKAEEFYSVYIITEDVYNIYEQTEKIYNKYVDNDDASLNYNSDLLRWYGVSKNENAIEMIWGVALILIIVIMIASIIVIYNAFNISFIERKKQFGMLSSIGATSKQLRKMIFKEGLFLSIIGIPLGILGSIIGIGITLLVINNLNIFSNFIDTRLVLTVSSLSILITIIFGSLTIFLSCLVPAIKASKTTPIDAIRLSKDYFIKAKSIKTWRINRRILGIEGDIALKNLKRNKKKYRSTILSIFVSICLFITINAFAEYSLRSSLKIFSSLNYDVIIINEDREESEKLVKHRDVKRSSISQTFWVDFNLTEETINPLIIDMAIEQECFSHEQGCPSTIAISSLGEKEFNYYLDLLNESAEKYYDINNPTIILMKNSNIVYKQHYYQIPLTTYKVAEIISTYRWGDDSKFNSNLKIGSIVDTYPIGFSDIDQHNFMMQAFVSDKVYNFLIDKFPEDYTNAEDYIYIKTDKVDNYIDYLEEYKEKNNLSFEVRNIKEMISMFENIILAISIFIYGFVILISLITITNIINTISTSIYLRKREFGMLRSVGMTNYQFKKMMILESVFYGVKALIYGLPIGILIDYAIYKEVSNLYIYEYAFPYKSVLICIFFVFIIVFTTTIYTIRKIKNDNIVDVIRQDNI